MSMGHMFNLHDMGQVDLRSYLTVFSVSYLWMESVISITIVCMYSIAVHVGVKLHSFTTKS